MKACYFVLFSFTLVFAGGCEHKSPEGGPGAKPSGSTVGTSDNSFKLGVPGSETTVKQGEIKPITIDITRGKSFDQDVKITFSDPPKGVKLNPATPTLKAGEKSVQFSIDAGADAALGEHEITVTGTPAKSGDPTSAKMKIQIKKS